MVGSMRGRDARRLFDDLANFLLEIDRVTRWFLLLMIMLFFISGYAMVGKFGFEKVLPRNMAAKIHSTLDVPTLILLMIHCCPRIYLRLRKVKSWVFGKRR